MTGHLSLQQRWRIVTLRRDCNLSLRKIAQLVNCSFSSVRHIVNLFDETNTVLEREGRGRHAIIRGPIRREFRQILSRYPTSTSAAIADSLTRRSGVQISPRTVRRVRRNENYHPVLPKVQWEINENQAERRYEYAIEHEDDHWKTVIFTDEKKFAVDHSGVVHWIPIGQRRPKIFIPQVRFFVNVFGAVWNGGKSKLVFIPGKSNSTTYLEHLKLALGDFLPSLRNFSLIHDRTTWSHSNMAHDWLLQNRIECLDTYPSVSPELNAVESVWGWMKKFVQSRHPRSQQQLEDSVRKAWQQIPITVIQGYIKHIKTTVHKIISADGWAIDD